MNKKTLLAISFSILPLFVFAHSGEGASMIMFTFLYLIYGGLLFGFIEAKILTKIYSKLRINEDKIIFINYLSSLIFFLGIVAFLFLGQEMHSINSTIILSIIILSNVYEIIS